MKSSNQQSSELPSEAKPDPEFIARQLRKPSGDFAPEVGQTMDQVNEPLYDLTLDVMQPEDNKVILEIGFGTGKFFDKLFTRANGLQICGIDFSEAMVRVAKENNEDAISSGDLKVEVASSNAIPFPDQSFDKVFCNMVVYFWDRPEIHLKEVRRVLKPEGAFYTGMRSRKSMLVFPFVEYGFNLYRTEEWEDILVQNSFLFEKTEKRFDPEIDFEDKKLRLESCCIVAEKRSE